MNNKKLLYILIVLGLIFLLTQLFNQKKERSFKSELVAVDTALVTKIILHPQAEGHHEIILEKTGQGWTAQQGDLKVSVAQGTLDGILRELMSIKVKSIVTQSKDRWKEYEVEDSTGSRVEVYLGNKKSFDFYSGKFGFNQQANNMISYLRMAGEPQVYAVDGFQSMSFNPSFSNFRDKSLVQIQPADISQLKLNQSGTTQLLSKINQVWNIDGKPVSDSAAVEEYIQGIANISGTQIIDGFTPGPSTSHELDLTTGNKTISVRIFPSGDSLKPFIIHSSSNPDNYFKEDSTGAFNAMITGWKSLQTKLAPKK